MKTRADGGAAKRDQQAMAMSSDELRSTIEAILFVSGEPVSLDRLAEALPDEGRESIAAEVERIRKNFEESVGGFGLEETGGGFRFASRPGHDSLLRKFFTKQGEGRLSLAALETLAIIAYRQPMTAPEISDIRGVNSSGVLRTLLDRRMIRIAGRKAVVGSPFLYRTTREFLMHFGLNVIQDLPRLEEFGDLLGDNVAEAFLNEEQEASFAEAQMDGNTGVVQPEPADEPSDGEDVALESDEVPAENAGESEELDIADSMNSEVLTGKHTPAGSDPTEELEEEGSETERKTVEFPGNDTTD
ncbi:MAG TPA: SMC-Scp complex subunit ScpB [Thermoanaerobaculia bacterium]|nr:SMC-Scp complex subunit ScpB [Thermoanaerobaculia bacterium]